MTFLLPILMKLRFTALAPNDTHAATQHVGFNFRKTVLTFLEHPHWVSFPFAFTFCGILREQIKFCNLYAGFGDRIGNLIPLPKF
jgi:hypothetical protein